MCSHVVATGSRFKVDYGVIFIAIVLIVVLLAVGVAVFWWVRSNAPGGEQIGALLLRLTSVVALGVVAMFCVSGLLYLSTPPTPKPSPEIKQIAQESTEPGATAAAATASATNSQATLGVAGQIVSILGAIGAAAVGGIAGLLVGQATQKPEPLQGGGGQGGGGQGGGQGGV